MAKVKTGRDTERARVMEIYERLHRMYPDARVALNYKTALDLLVATILAAQSTDVRVNQVTDTLFKKYRVPQDYLAVSEEEFQDEVRSCGFFRQKTRSIRGTCEKIIKDFGGRVPDTMEGLVSLPGVGRKTANVVLSTCYDTPGIIVDTHVRRVSARLGFTKNTDPDKIEQDLMVLWPRDIWTMYSHVIVFHGRTICVARMPKCSVCPVNELCPYPTTGKPKR